MDKLNQVLESIFLIDDMITVKKKDAVTQRQFFNDRAKTLFNITQKPKVIFKDHLISLKGREINSRCYIPEIISSDGAIVFYHGGGWMLHNIDVYQLFCFYLADICQCKVISVEYRLSPEHKFPQGVDDAIDSMQWIFDNAKLFGINPKKLIVAGDSAGGNYAAVICHERLKHGLPLPLAQVLIYPAVDMSKVYPSQEKFSGLKYSLDKDWLQMMFDEYFTNPSREAFSSKASPILNKNFSQQPDVMLIIADHDPLQDEIMAYQNKLEAAGVEVETHHYPTMPHGFISFIGIVDESLDAINKISKFCKSQFDKA
jgi:acetyl esterase